MFQGLRNRHFFFLDILLLPLAVYASYVLRLEQLTLGIAFWPGFALFALVSMATTIVLFRVSGVYSRYWRYASIDELLLLAGSVTVAMIAAGMICFFLLWLLPVNWMLPRSVPLIYLLIAVVVTAVPRLSIRIWTVYEWQGYRGANVQKVLIVGAGDAGSMIGREMQRISHLHMLPVGFVDDDKNKQGVRIHGIPVLGKCEDVPALVSQFDIRQVIIALPTAPGKVVREIVGICEKARVQTKIIPGIYELLDGTVSINQLRDVDIEDLLRREAVQTDITAVQSLISGKRVLITGGGGSIGSELCRQVLRCQPAEIVLVGHGENSIFAINHELNRLRSGMPIKITPVIADVRFAERIQAIFSKYRPEVVFHAAAHKHVPLMELNPTEAVTNNVQGTQNLLQAALAVNVSHFVMISTDKAVNPTSIMGASKRAAELLVHEAAKTSGQPYVTVRFGNVLGSRGSVVLTFKQQIAAGGPVTVTHPDMERFFMTIPEAVQLVLQAATLGKGGEVFVLDMGEPVRIVDLARDLIELSGLEVGRDIDIVFTGTRPGEKLFEELFVPGEKYHRTAHEKVFWAANASSFIPSDLHENIDALVVAAYRDDAEGVVRSLQNLIPEFMPMRFKTTPLVVPEPKSAMTEDSLRMSDPSFAG